MCLVGRLLTMAWVGSCLIDRLWSWLAPQQPMSMCFIARAQVDAFTISFNRYGYPPHSLLFDKYLTITPSSPLAHPHYPLVSHVLPFTPFSSLDSVASEAPKAAQMSDNASAGHSGEVRLGLRCGTSAVRCTCVYHSSSLHSNGSRSPSKSRPARSAGTNSSSSSDWLERN